MKAREQHPAVDALPGFVELELGLAWRAFEHVPAPWTITIDGVQGEITIDGREFLDVCAAVELDRFDARDMHMLRAHVDQRRRTPLPWRTLTTGALGLKRSEAWGELTIGDVLRRLAVTVVRVETGAGVRFAGGRDDA